MGFWGGTLTSLVVTPITIMLLHLAGDIPLRLEVTTMPALALVVTGSSVGWLRTLNLRLRRDLGEQRQMEEELRESEKRFMDIVDNTVEWIWEVDDRGKYTYVSSAVEKILGYRPEELLDKHFYDLFHVEEREDLKNTAFEVFSRKEKLRGFLNRNVHKNGSTVWLSTSGVPVLDSKGNLAGYRGADTDVTEIRKEETLRAALYRISEITNSAEDMQEFYSEVHTVVGELMCAKNFYIVLYDSSRQILDFPYFVDERDPKPQSRKLGRGLTEYVIRTGRPLLTSVEAFDEMVERGDVELLGSPSIDWLGVPLKRGTETFGALAVQSYTEDVRFGEQDKEILMFVSQHIATAYQRKHAQEELRSSEEHLRKAKAELEKWNMRLESEVRSRTKKLEEAQEKLLHAERLAAIGAVAAGMGHELRNPLGVMKNVAYYLRAKVDGTDHKIRKYVGRLEQEIEHANEIVTTLLDFSRPLSLSLSRVDVDCLMEDVLERASVPSNVQVTLELNRGLPKILADGEKLSEVFDRLILNAIQAMPKGGELRLKTRADTDDVEIEVEDTGVGVAEADREKIFEPLYTTKAKGIGLGLSLSRKYVTAHGGTLEINDGRSEGTSFLVKLPTKNGKLSREVVRGG